jgi:hypothetical protein
MFNNNIINISKPTLFNNDNNKNKVIIPISNKNNLTTIHNNNTNTDIKNYFDKLLGTSDNTKINNNFNFINRFIDKLLVSMNIGSKHELIRKYVIEKDKNINLYLQYRLKAEQKTKQLSKYIFKKLIFRRKVGDTSPRKIIPFLNNNKEGNNKDFVKRLRKTFKRGFYILYSLIIAILSGSIWYFKNLSDEREKRIKELEYLIERIQIKNIDK